MGQNLFKKHSKFQNLDEVFYCGMTKLIHTRSILRKNNMRQNLSKKYSKIQKYPDSRTRF